MLIVEDGSGVFGANSYGSAEECATYLSVRGDLSWATGTDPTPEAQEAALIRATDYIEMKYGTRFSGVKSYPVLYNARATITFLSMPVEGELITIGLKTYRFTSNLTDPNDVLLQGRTSEVMANLVAAINFETGYYSPSTTENLDVAARKLDGRKITLEAKYLGEDGNDIAVIPQGASVVSNFETLVGGNEIGISQPLSFPRSGIYIENVLVRGIPLQLKHATFELARRAVTIDLLPDPDQDASGRVVVMKSEKVGPIEDTVKFSGYSQIENLMRQYPAADRLIRPLLGSGNGRVTR